MLDAKNWAVCTKCRCVVDGLAAHQQYHRGLIEAIIYVVRTLLKAARGH